MKKIFQDTGARLVTNPGLRSFSKSIDLTTGVVSPLTDEDLTSESDWTEIRGEKGEIFAFLRAGLKMSFPAVVKHLQKQRKEDTLKLLNDAQSLSVHYPSAMVLSLVGKQLSSNGPRLPVTLTDLATVSEKGFSTYKISARSELWIFPLMSSQYPFAKPLFEVHLVEQVDLPKTTRLSKSLQDIHYLILQGLTNEEIAAVRNVSVYTIKNQKQMLFQKLGIDASRNMVSVYFLHYRNRLIRAIAPVLVKPV